jgi:hypothetical protein
VIAPSSQNRKVFDLGSPIGQQQDGDMRLTGVGVETGGGGTRTTGMVMMTEDRGGRE